MTSGSWRTAAGPFAIAVASLAIAFTGGCAGPSPSAVRAAGPGASATAGIPGAPAAPSGGTELATLVRVVDGDTIRVTVGGREERVRYIGMNTPEMNAGSNATPEPFAVAATDANARLVTGAQIVMERDVSERDQYGRLLRDIWIRTGDRWLLVNLELVAEGYAQVDTFPPDVKYVDALRAAQRAARAAGRGLWGR